MGLKEWFGRSGSKPGSGQATEDQRPTEPEDAPMSLPNWGIGAKKEDGRGPVGPATNAVNEPEGEADPSLGESFTAKYRGPNTFNSSFAGSVKSFDVCSQKTASFDGAMDYPYYNNQRLDPPLPIGTQAPLDPVAASPLYIPAGDAPPSPAVTSLPPAVDMPADEVQLLPPTSEMGAIGFPGAAANPPSALPPLGMSLGDCSWQDADQLAATAAQLRQLSEQFEAAGAEARAKKQQREVGDSQSDSSAVPGAYLMPAGVVQGQPMQAAMWGMPAVWYPPPEAAWQMQQYPSDYGCAYPMDDQWFPENAEDGGTSENAKSKKSSKKKKASPGESAAKLAADIKDEERTTLMLRNIPNNYTRQMLLELLDKEGLEGQYDFVYLPMDFKSFAGLGYAFVNLVTHESAARAKDLLDGFTQWKAASEKVCSVAWGHPLQGFDAHVERYRNSPVMHPDVPEKFKPAAFKNGVKIEFPAPTKKIAAPRCKRTDPGQA